MKKYILYGLLALILGVFVYHFIAANQAERDIREAILETNSRNNIFFSLSTSSLQVHPFSGDLTAKDFNAINRSYIIRIGSAVLDLRYGDFLNIYINGPEYGLKNIDNGNLTLQSLDLIWRITFFEINTDTLTIAPLNNLANLLRSDDLKESAGTSSYLNLNGKKFRFSHPDSIHGFIRANSIQFKKWLPGNSRDTVQHPDSLLLTDVTWTLPTTLRRKYDFFIRGFDFEEGRVPIETIELIYKSSRGGRLLQIENCTIRSDLFTATINGEILADYDMMEFTKINRLDIRIADFSDKFSTFLNNLETLLNIQIPREGEDIHFGLSGTLFKPEIDHNTQE